jgi:4-hydroxy-2-oxoheptanedioate aldolase
MKQIWREGGFVTLGWLSVGNSFTAEVMARQGFDALCIDMQHGLIDYNDVWPMLQAISQTDTVPVVRVPWNDPQIIMKALDAGAYGLIVPLINTADEAAAAVSAARYPPAGIRSFGPVRAGMYAGANYAQEANDEIVVFGMIETKQGIDNVDAICATPGLDGVYIGPADLSFALGLPPQGDNETPIHLETCDRIRDTAHKHGKKAAMHTASARFSAGSVARGFDLVMLTSDIGCMTAGARRQLDELKQLTSAAKQPAS